MDARDTALVRRSISGDADAFDELVRRHRGAVFAFAYSTTRDYDEAEDLAEEIFIEAFRSLPNLRDGGKFKAWLRTIAQRVVARWVQGQRKERELFSSTPMDGLPEGVIIGWMPTVEEQLLLNERRAAVRQVVRELSACHRQVVTLHYIDGLSCEDISRRLRVPLGTVKRRLHDARDSLRREMTRMGIAPQTKQKALTGKLQIVQWGTCSSNGRHNHPFTLCRPLIVQRILVAIAKEAKKVEYIAEEVKTDKAYVLDELERLERNELVVKVSKDRYRANCFVLLRDDQTAMAQTVRTVGEKAAAVIADELPKFKQIVASCSFAQKGFGWEQVQWIIVPCFLANLGVRRCYSELFALTPPLRPNGDHWYAYLIEETAEAKWMAVCNNTRTEKSGTAHFWTPQVRKKSISPLDETTHFYVISPLAQQPKTLSQLLDHLWKWMKGLADDLAQEDPQALARLLGLPSPASPDTEQKMKETYRRHCDTVRERLSRLVELGYVSKRGHKFHLNFPVFVQDDLTKLEQETERVCRRIVEEVYKPVFANMERLFDRLGYRHLKEQYPALKAHVGANATGCTIGALVERSVLPQPPAEAPATWGFWAWIGKSGLLPPM